MDTSSPTTSSTINYEGVRRGGEYGFIGILLFLIGGVLSIVSHMAGVVVGIVGQIIFLVSLHELSEELGEERIFTYGIYSLVVSIIGGVIIIAGFATAVIPFFTSLSVVSIIRAAVAAFIALYIMIVIIGYLYKRIFEMLSDNTEILDQDVSRNFKSAAKWYWIGALLFVIIVGALLAIVGEIYALIAFNNLQHIEQPPTALSTTVQSST